MHAEIAAKKEDVIALCRRFDVARLKIFGSAARAADFNPDASDVDFLVEFLHASPLPPLEQFFGLADALNQLLGHPVDPLESGAVRNPFVLEGIQQLARARLRNVSCEPISGISIGPPTLSNDSSPDWTFKPTSDRRSLTRPSSESSKSSVTRLINSLPHHRVSSFNNAFASRKSRRGCPLNSPPLCATCAPWRASRDPTRKRSPCRFRFINPA